MTGANHPLTPPRHVASVAATTVQYSFIAFIAAGDRYVFPVLRVPVPPWYRSMTENRIAAIMMTFFAGNMVTNSLSQTGAFEVYYDGVLVWSKLQSGQPPNLAQIAKALKAARG